MCFTTRRYCFLLWHHKGMACFPHFSFTSLQSKFKPFCKYAKSFNSDDFDYEELDRSDYIFMRWKVSQPQPDAVFSFPRPPELPLLTWWPCHPFAKGAVPGSRSHHQRHQRSLLCWLLLHLFPEVHSDDRGLLLPQDLGMVNSQVKICHKRSLTSL